jgi:hypothetical protein
MRIVNFSILEGSSSESLRAIIAQGWTAFRIVVRGAPYDKASPIHTWCADNFHPDDWIDDLQPYGYLSGMTHKFFAFRRPGDAVAFFLRWA